MLLGHRCCLDKGGGGGAWLTTNNSRPTAKPPLVSHPRQQPTANWQTACLDFPGLTTKGKRLSVMQTSGCSQFHDPKSDKIEGL